MTSYPVDEFVASRRMRETRRVKQADGLVLVRLKELHERLNVAHFHSSLPATPFRRLGRMRTSQRLLTVDPTASEAREIAPSTWQLDRDHWGEVEHTVLQKMVHQWQAERGLEIDHGANFRWKAHEVGILPRAGRDVRTTPGSVRYN